MQVLVRAGQALQSRCARMGFRQIILTEKKPAADVFLRAADVLFISRAHFSMEAFSEEKASSGFELRA